MTIASLWHFYMRLSPSLHLQALLRSVQAKGAPVAAALHFVMSCVSRTWFMSSRERSTGSEGAAHHGAVSVRVAWIDVHGAPPHHLAMVPGRAGARGRNVNAGHGTGVLACSTHAT